MKQQTSTLFEKVRKYYEAQQYPQFFQLIDGALLLAEQYGETDLFIEFTLHKVSAYFQFCDYEIAIQALQEVEHLISDEASEAYIRYVNAKAAIHGALEDHETCYQYLCEAKRLAIQRQSMKSLMIIEANIGNYFYEKQRYDEALVQLKRSLQICDDLQYEAQRLYLSGRSRYIQICIKLGLLEEAAAHIAHVQRVPNYEQLPHYRMFIKAVVAYDCAREQYLCAYERLQKEMQALHHHESSYSYLYELFVEVAQHVEPLAQYVDTLRAYYDYRQQREEEHQQQRAKRLDMYFKTDHLQQLSWLDPLTQIKNRRYLDDHGASWLAESTTGVAVILFDADNFKHINDTYGHSMGDEVISLMAKCAETFFDNEDALVIRYGGDEFLVLCRIEDEDVLHAVLDSFQCMMHAQSYGDDEPLYISIGATFQQQAPYVLDALIAHADAALYAVKQQGRQHFSIYRAQ